MGWYLSNLLGEQEKKCIKPEEYGKRRYREIWNLLGKLGPMDGVRLLLADTFLDKNTKQYYLKQYARRMATSSIM